MIPQRTSLPKRKAPRRLGRRTTWTPSEKQWLWRIGALRFVLPDEWRLKYQKSKVPSAIPPPAYFTDYGKLLDEYLESNSNTRLTLSQWRDRIEELLDKAIPKKRESDQEFPREVVSHIKRRLGLPEQSIRPFTTRLVGIPSTDRRVDLVGPSQLSCLLEWCGIHPDLWGNTSWRECMTLRYDHRQISPIEWLSPELRGGLNDLISKLRREGAKEKLPDSGLTEVVRLVVEKERGVKLKVTIAHLYVTAELGDPSSSHFLPLLQRPVSDGEFFRFVAKSETQGKYSIGIGASFVPVPTTDSFIKYLAIPDGHSREVVGRVLYHLLRLEDWNEDHFLSPLASELEAVWPGVRLSEAYEHHAEFVAFADALSKGLGLDRKVVDRVFTSFVSMWYARATSRQWKGDGYVFWAARVLEAISPYQCLEYREWIRYLQTRLRSSGNKKPAPVDDNVQLAGIARSLLSAEPLLNCVFHSDLFHGIRQVSGRPRPPIVNSTLINSTLAYAYLVLSDGFPTRPKATISDVLRRMGKLPSGLQHLADDEYWRESVEAVDVGPRSLFAFLTPIAIILFGGYGRTRFTPPRVKFRCLSNVDLPDVVAFRQDWFAHSKKLMRLDS